jgi:hypothetical protein
MILAANSDRPEAFHREIIHTGFEGNPRFSGGIEMQLSKEYQNNLFRHEVAGRWQLAAMVRPHLPAELYRTIRTGG